MDVRSRMEPILSGISKPTPYSGQRVIEISRVQEKRVDRFQI